MDQWLQTLIAVIIAIMASTGFWQFIESRSKKQSASTQLLLGLAHDRIVFLGMSFVDRGFVTKDEYEDFVKYLYNPYAEHGGNGLAEKVMEEVKKLPIRGAHTTRIILAEENRHEQ